MIASVLGSAIPTLIAIIGASFYIGDRLGSLESEVKSNSEAINDLKGEMGCDDED